jgi:hypothetical protein
MERGVREPPARHHPIASSAMAGSDVTTSSFMTGASVALVKANDVVYRAALPVYANAGGTAAHLGATVPTVDPG